MGSLDTQTDRLTDLNQLWSYYGSMFPHGNSGALSRVMGQRSEGPLPYCKETSSCHSFHAVCGRGCTGFTAPQHRNLAVRLELFETISLTECNGLTSEWNKWHFQTLITRFRFTQLPVQEMAAYSSNKVHLCSSLDPGCHRLDKESENRKHQTFLPLCIYDCALSHPTHSSYCWRVVLEKWDHIQEVSVVFEKKVASPDLMLHNKACDIITLRGYNPKHT